jgi:hypothetical protein
MGRRIWLIPVAFVVWIGLGLLFDREPRFKHLQIYQSGKLLQDIDGVHLERQDDDLVYYRRYENLTRPYRLVGAFRPGSNIVISSSPELGRQ